MSQLKMSYPQFLFCQLLMANVTEFKNMEYDRLFERSLQEFDTYAASPFNLEARSEHDCMVAYIHSVYGQDFDETRPPEAKRIVNGYAWVSFESGIHKFAMNTGDGWFAVCCETAQLYNGDIEFMTEKGLSLSPARMRSARNKYLKKIQNQL